MLTSIALIFLLGLGFGWLFSKLKLPSLIGMILVGILISPYALNLIDTSILSIAGDIRQIALVIILTRAGLSLDITACCFALLSSRLCGNARNHPPCTAPARCQCLGGGNHRQCACGSFACGHCATHDSFDRAGLWQGKQYSANDSGRSISG